jgi:alkanesulfonate monooxygenase SsuD/methylene tetrahydromethanopterin reductase-like flavin-dependent oxidoreductase (luciferase family)
MTTTFGLTLPQRAALFGASSMPEMFDLARQADSNPLFDSAWVGDSLMAKPRPESLTMLGALAGITQNLKLGVGCMASFPVRDPFVFAYQWANLDFISEGRMILAACTGIVQGGASAAEGANWGVLDKERAARLEENIDIVRKLWTGDKVTYEGKWHSYQEAFVQPAPMQDPCPIWIASNPSPAPGREHVWERALHRVARLSDGWMTVQMFPQMLKTNWNKIETYLAEEGRDAASFPTIAYHNLNVGSDKQACLEESKRFLDEYYGPVFSPEMVENWTAAGTPDEVVEHLRQLIEDGAKTITLRLTSWDQRGQYQRMVEEILPRLQEVTAG